MPVRGDHDARRAHVSEAVWRVLAARGFGGLTLRAVAAELDSSTGLLTHYFPDKRALVRYALDLAEERSRAHPRWAAESEGHAALRAALLDVLPLNPEKVEMSRVWVSSWDAGIGDPELGALHGARYVRWRERLRPHIETAIRLGQFAVADPDRVAVRCAAFAHGLVVQVLFDPERFPVEVQIRLLDEFLRSVE
ncbi:MAG TPA: TetR family transcriptional regulator C-terminal domain-containing protein [Pseudonocardiaceae bacterium]|nr:TetR family transcriptional regulator C-terminal domain-containing protein [Pseudonocardiaceae bacterium]